jgi:hypothetical protein
MEHHKNGTLIIGIFGIIFYIVLSIAVLDLLADADKAIKKSVFEMYHVPEVKK